MSNIIQKKIEDIRKKPEKNRIKIAFRIVIAVGTVIILLWVLVLLPLQVKSDKSKEKDYTLEQGKEDMKKNEKELLDKYDKLLEKSGEALNKEDVQLRKKENLSDNTSPVEVLK